MLKRLTVADFEPLRGSTFRAELPSGPLELELTQVTAHPERSARPGAATGRPFSLLFRAPTPHHVLQGIFALSHDRLGRLDVFMVPVGRDAGGLLLEAIFN